MASERNHSDATRFKQDTKQSATASRSRLEKMERFSKAGMLYQINTMIKNETFMRQFGNLAEKFICNHLNDLSSLYGAIASTAQALLLGSVTISRQTYAVAPVVASSRQITRNDRLPPSGIV